MSCFSAFRISKPSDEQLSHAIDKALEGIDKGLEIFGEITKYVPVPGADKVVPVIQSVVAMIKQTRANDQAANDLIETIAALVNLLQTTKEKIVDKIKEMDNAIQRKSDIDSSQINEALEALYKYALRGLRPVDDAGYKTSGKIGYLEGTRVDVLEDLLTWAKGADGSSEKIFIFSGAAGTGKSTLVYEVARRLEDEKILGGSFFFKRSDAGDLGSIRAVFPTLAFQLASSLPNLQLEKLMLGPLRRVAVHSPIVFVLDAIDETSESTEDIDAFITFLKLLKRLTALSIPFRILISTRPEPPILSAIEDAGCEPPAKHFDMAQIPPERKLLDQRPNAIEKLAEKAEHLFIYAQTVVQALKGIKQVEPAVKLLDLTLQGKGSASSTLDSLYITVLENAFPQSSMSDKDVSARVHAVLAGIVVLQDQVTLDILTGLFGITSESVLDTLMDLRSVIIYDEENVQTGKIYPLHSTFREFLVDQSRCQRAEYYIDSRIYHGRLAAACLRALNSTLRRNICKLPDPTVLKDEVLDLPSHVNNIAAHVQYACKYWATHLTRADFTPDISQLLREFCQETLLLWFEALSMMNRLEAAVPSLLDVFDWYQMQSSIEPEISGLLSDGHRLVLEYFVAINSSPEQIYISALPLAPTCQLVSRYTEQQDGSACRSLKLVSPRNAGWNACLCVIEGHKGRVNSVKFSSDGRWIVSGAGDNTVRIWDAATGRPWKALEGHTDDVESVDFHPDNLHVISGSSDGTVRIWDPLSNTPTMRVLPAYRGNVFSVAYSTDAKKIVSGSFQSVIHVWNPDSDTAAPIIPSYNCVNSVAFLKMSGNMQETLDGHTDMAKCAKFFPNGSRVVSGASDNTFSRDGHRAVTASNDETIIVWDTTTGKALHTLKGHPKGVECVTFSPDRSRVASGGQIDGIRIWDAETGECLQNLRHSPKDMETAQALAWSPDGKWIASAASNLDPFVRLWDANEGILARTIDMLYTTTFLDLATEIAFSRDSRFVSVKTVDKLFYVWDVATGALQGTTEEDFKNSDGTHKDFQLESGWIRSVDSSKHLCWIPENMRAFKEQALATQGNLIALGAGSGRFTILDMSNLAQQLY
ncbi:hypothetical protein OBBRIDRAFT_835570 [Obba rivulosa]|uniref:NACHT domain-containing protein n=1 Tax=Obba rivulosa TaxID=1052685 RepID=A0A8E2AX58_9APHY|nr:hypothetical protein OBBRIDRAFT_835570 [Obba rivulosa]